jgi:hypothetical protein
MSDPEPAGPVPGPHLTTGHRRLLLVPVTPGHAGTLALRTGRLPSGQRTGLAFTSPAALHAALGPEQAWTKLTEPALRDLLRPLGVQQIRLDPLAARVARAAGPVPPRTPHTGGLTAA